MFSIQFIHSTTNKQALIRLWLYSGEETDARLLVSFQVDNKPSKHPIRQCSKLQFISKTNRVKRKGTFLRPVTAFQRK